MADPARAADIALACKVGMLPEQFRREVTHAEKIELMAYELTNNKEWRENYEKELAIKQSESMTEDELARHVMAVFNTDNK